MVSREFSCGRNRLSNGSPVPKNACVVPPLKHEVKHGNVDAIGAYRVKEAGLDIHHLARCRKE